ncbi:hypothetical protein Tco_0627746 [Tanacetum coccineum]|uniref:Uncharacterized protein n=1 Tax=Tanacetum coccineum TaxID=301880 RepID=A0ABQ4WNB7_9ASTR
MTVQERYTDEEQEQTRNHWSMESLLKVNPQNYQEHPGCQITRETVTIDQHDELIKMGIKPTLKGVKWDQKFPYVIFCAPPSRSLEFRLCCIRKLYHFGMANVLSCLLQAQHHMIAMRAVKVRHHRVGETEEPAIYRINDDLGFEAYEKFLALSNQEAGGSGSGSAPKKKRTYIPCERENAEQRLIDDYFSEDDTPPKYTEEYFRRKYRMSSTLFLKIVNYITNYDAQPLPEYFCFFKQRIDVVGCLSIGPILKCTSAIRQLEYGTTLDAFDEYLQIAELCSRECLENFTKCIYILYVEEFLRRPTLEDIEKHMHCTKKNKNSRKCLRVLIICIGIGKTAQSPYMVNLKDAIINTQLLC